MSTTNHEPPDLAAYHARYTFTRGSESRTMAQIQKRDSKPRASSGWKRSYHQGAVDRVDGVGGAAANTRGAVIAGKKKSDGK